MEGGGWRVEGGGLRVRVLGLGMDPGGRKDERGLLRLCKAQGFGCSVFRV